MTIDDDLAGLLKARAWELGISFKEVVNRALRSGLGASAGPSTEPPPKTIPHAFGIRPGFDPDKLNQLADELEAEAFESSWRKQNE